MMIHRPLKKSVRLVGLTAILTLPIGGCSIDLTDVVKDLQRPKVVFAEAIHWRCGEPVKIPNGATVDTCDRCQNMATTPQRVTIEQVETAVPPGDAVLMCPRAAWVEAR